jgi:uncharacterized membrane protein YphA (DoxX/SURF4 family)
VSWAINDAVIPTYDPVAEGAIFPGVGILKFFPRVSPAQNLSTATLSGLTVGLVPPRVGIILIASLESFIGVCLITGRKLRLTIWLLCIELVGILSPLVLLPGRLFTPDHAPNIVGQYVLKDLILTAAVVVFISALRDGKLVGEKVTTRWARSAARSPIHSFAPPASHR